MSKVTGTGACSAEILFFAKRQKPLPEGLPRIDSQMQQRSSFLTDCLASWCAVRLVLHLVIVISAIASAQDLIYNQDGMGFSGYVKPHPMEGYVNMTGFPLTVAGTGTLAFAGGVFDGVSLWLIPFSAPEMISVDVNNGSMTRLVSVGGSNAFGGGVYDGVDSIWLIPFFSNSLVRVSTSTGQSLSILVSVPGVSSTLLHLAGQAFEGGVFDGTYVWLSPRNSQYIVRVNVAGNVSMSAFGAWPTGTLSLGNFAFYGAVLGGGSMWLIPSNSQVVVSINVSNGNMTGYSAWPKNGSLSLGNLAFCGGLFDGRNIWLIPRNAQVLVRVDVLSGNMTGYTAWPSGNISAGSSSFTGGVFDGKYLWLAPRSSHLLVRVDSASGIMKGFSLLTLGSSSLSLGNDAFIGGIFDGSHVWLVPYNSKVLVRVSTTPSLSLSHTASSSATRGTSSPSQLASLSATAWTHFSKSMTVMLTSTLSTQTQETKAEMCSHSLKTTSVSSTLSGVSRARTAARPASATTLASQHTKHLLMTTSISASHPFQSSAKLTISLSPSWRVAVMQESLSSTKSNGNEVGNNPHSELVMPSTRALTSAAILVGVLASISSGPSSAADMQTVVIATLARCTPTSTSSTPEESDAQGSYLLATPLALSDSARGALGGNAVAFACLAAVIAAVFVVLRFVRKQSTEDALAGSRCPGYLLLLVGTLQQSTLFCALRLMTRGGEDGVNGLDAAMGAMAAVCVLVVYPAVVLGAVAKVPRRFVMYEYADDCGEGVARRASQYSRLPWSFLAPFGVTLPDTTRRMSSSLITGYRYPSLLCVGLPIALSVLVNVVAALPASTPSWLCEAGLIMLAVLHAAAGVGIAMSQLYRLPSGNVLGMCGMLLTSIFFVQLASGSRGAIDATLSAQAALSLARSLASACTIVVESKIRQSPQVQSSLELWVVGLPPHSVQRTKTNQDALAQHLLLPPLLSSEADIVEKRSLQDLEFNCDVECDEIELRMATGHSTKVGGAEEMGAGSIVGIEEPSIVDDLADRPLTELTYTTLVAHPFNIGLDDEPTDFLRALPMGQQLPPEL